MQLLTLPMPLSPEVIDDRVATVLDAGDNVTIVYDDAANILTISAGTGAPIGAEYVTSTADATLSAERVLTDTATVSWDRSVPGQIKATAGGVGGYTNEDAQDAVGGILADSATIDFLYNDATPSISGFVKDNSITEPMLNLNDNTTKDATAAVHGLLMKLSGNTVHFLRGDGTWVTPPGGYTDEQAQDAIGAILVDTATIDLTYTDATPSIVADVKDASITEAKLLLADNTTQNVNTTRHGLVPKAPNSATQYLDGTGVWSTPAGGGVDTEGVQDTVSTMLTDSTTIDFTYNDVAGTETADVKDGSITFAKMQTVTASRLLGRGSSSAGVPEQITIAGAFTMVGTALGIANAAVTFAKIQNINENKLLGRYSTGSGDTQEVNIGNDLNLNKTSGELNLPSRFLLIGA